MKRWSKFLTFDRTATIIGIIVTLLIFLIQGPHDKPWKIYLPFTPLLIVFIILAINRITKEVYKKKFQYLLEEYKIVTMTRIVATWHGRIENEKGDLTYRKEYRMTLVQPGTIHKTKGETTYVQNELPNLPPTIVTFLSNNAQRKISPTEVTRVNELINAENCFKYEWRYNIIPPLSHRGEYIDYAYEFQIPGALQNAFTNEGDILIFEQRKIQQETHISIISPTGYIFLLIECFIEDYNGQRKEIPELDQKPKLLEDGSIFSWTIEYIHLSRYICTFKLVKK